MLGFPSSSPTSSNNLSSSNTNQNQALLNSSNMQYLKQENIYS